MFLKTGTHISNVKLKGKPRGNEFGSAQPSLFRRYSPEWHFQKNLHLAHLLILSPLHYIALPVVASPLEICTSMHCTALTHIFLEVLQFVILKTI